MYGSRFCMLVLLLVLFSVFSQAQPTFTISTVAGNGAIGFSGDAGPATNATLSDPRGVDVDSKGNVYFADLANNRVRKIDSRGIISTVAGNGVAGFSGDGGLAINASLNQPIRVHIDSTGNILIADSHNFRVRKVDPSGVITTLAGNGNAGQYGGDGGPAVNAALGAPADCLPDNLGNVYIPVTTSGEVIRKVDSSGVITTIAGNGTVGFSGDGGPALSAQLNNPVFVALDSAGGLYVCDQFNNRVRKITGSVITTVAGNGAQGFSGDGGAATAAALNSPAGIYVDQSGNLYIADSGNNRLRVVQTSGKIATVAGNGVAAFGGDGGPALSASLNSPRSLAMGPQGNIYFVDNVNERVRFLTPTPTSPSVSTALSASAFGGATSAAPGSWIEIYGTNLASGTRSWSNSDFNGNAAPTSLDGTTVTVGGKSAFIDYISPTQVNALISSDTPTGAQQLVVKTANGTSTNYPITINALQPGLLAPSSFKVGSTQYAAGILPDGSYALPTGAIFGVPSRPAKPGDTLIFYGVGFGAVTPNAPAGQLVQQANALTSNFQISIGGIAATVLYGGLAPGYTGLYQFNVTVPNAAAGSAVPVTFSLANSPGTQTLSIAVSN